VTIYSGPRLAEQLTFGPPRAKSLKTEYSGLECTIEIVKDIEEAVKHIDTYGSGHTDVIVTQNGNMLFVFYLHYSRSLLSRRIIHPCTTILANTNNEKIHMSA
jgi:delta-1-pyrroline-5-carboxylate synthetase